MTKENKDKKEVKDTKDSKDEVNTKANNSPKAKEPAKDTKVDSTKESKKPKQRRLVHINTFIQTIKDVADVSVMEYVGFVANMEGQLYQYDERVFLEKLEEHLGRKVNINN